jgi:TetR/AcrR family acrAB operon transcriptional repressor
MRRTKREAEETREAILAAAERLFGERGVTDVSLDEVAEAAGFTRGAVHWHFQNKPGLLMALLDRMGRPLSQLAGQLEIDRALDPLEELVAVTTRALGELQLDPRRQRLATYLMNFAAVHAPERQRSFDRDLRASMRTIFRLAEKQGRLAPEWSPDTAALACFAMTSGLITEWLRGEAEFDLMTDAIAAVRAFVASLARTRRS